RADADALGLAADALALERLRDGRANRVRPVIDRQAIEREGQASGPLEPRRLRYRRDGAAHRRSRRHEYVAALVLQIDHRGRLELVLGNRRLRAERALKPDVELGADRNLVRVARSDRLSRRRAAVRFGSRARWRRVAAGRIAARAAADGVAPIARLALVRRRERLLAPARRLR